MNMVEHTYWNASLSTMWGMNKFSTLEEFYTTARSLGFAQVELNHQVDSAYLTGMDLARFAISSIHEPCPADISTHMLNARDWLVSATDPENRQQGVLAIKRSIDLASTLGIHALVVHPGNVRADWPREKELYNLFRNDLAHTSQFQDLRRRLTEERAALAAPRLAAVQQSLKELVEYAAPRRVCLGLENRYHYMDIPILDEMKSLLDLAGPEQLGFWYDVGHAQTLDRLGFFSHEEWLKRYAGRIVGVHLHDVVGIDDHGAPGNGDVDFSRIAGYLPIDAIHTLELRPSTTVEQMVQSLQFLAQKGCLQPLSTQ